MNMMESLFERIENIGAWESYIRTFQTIGVTDEELSAAMIYATFISNEELLYRLIADTRSGRRVFKQLCRKGTIPYIVSLDLHTRQELDLAFHVVVGNRLWSYALELYHHPDVTQRSRRQALQCAIREGSWDTVKLMVVSSVTPERDRRKAFLAAVRRNELAWAVHLCEQGVSVSDGDIRFAIKTCHATGQNQFVHMFLQLCANATGFNKCLKCILKESIHSGAVVLTENHQVSEYFESMEIGTYVDIEQPRIIQESAIAIDFPADEGYLNVPGISAHDDSSHPKANTATVDRVYSVCLQVQGTTDHSKDLPLYMVREAVKASNAGCFRLLCFQFSDNLNEAILRYAFKKAMQAGKNELVIKTIDVCEQPNSQHTRMLHFAVKLGMKEENFEFVKQVVDAHKECLSWSTFFAWNTGYIKAAKNWAVVMPILEPLIVCEYWLIELIQSKIGQRKLKLLASWCMQNECTRLALFLAVESKQWRLARRIIEYMSTPIPRRVFDIVFDKALSEREWSAAVSCLRRAPEDTELDPDMFWDLHGEAETLIQYCRSEGLTRWVIKVGICSENWQVVETEMESCDDESIFNFVLEEAASSDQWDLVSKLLNKCSGREPCLRKVLTCAVETSNCFCAKKLLNLIDPLAGAASEFNPLLTAAIRSENEEMIDLCIQSGVSTHQEADDMYISPMRCYLSGCYSGSAKISVVKALFESGACCHDELSQSKNHSFIKMHLQTREQREVLEFMEAASSKPRSLQSLCRLSVSHHIGCQPGRENRILSLPVPQRIKDFIMFKDILVASPSPEFGFDTVGELTGL